MPVSQTVKDKINQYRKNISKYFLKIVENENISNSEILLEILLRTVNEKIKHEIVTALKAEGALLSVNQLLFLDLDSKLEVRRSQLNPNNMVVSLKINQQSITIARVNIKEFFTAAVDEWKSLWINFLIDNQFVSYKPQKPSLPEAFQNGFWIRIFSKNVIDKEIDNLQKRAGLTPELLRGHGENYDEKVNGLGFAATHYSPATFIQSGYKISLFGFHNNCTGVILLPRNNRVIDYWYSGLGLVGEELTRDLDYRKSVLDGYEEDRHHFVGIKETEIFEVYPDCVRNGNVFQWGNQPDQYGVIEHSVQWTWNEGLFRYQVEAIYGIYVNPESITSIKAAFFLQEKLIEKFNLNVNQLPYYFYDPSSGTVERYSSKELQARLPYHQLTSVAAPSSMHMTNISTNNFFNAPPKPVASSSFVQEPKSDSSRKPSIN